MALNESIYTANNFGNSPAPDGGPGKGGSSGYDGGTVLKGIAKIAGGIAFSTGIPFLDAALGRSAALATGKAIATAPASAWKPVTPVGTSYSTDGPQGGQGATATRAEKAAVLTNLPWAGSGPLAGQGGTPAQEAAAAQQSSMLGKTIEQAKADYDAAAEEYEARGKELNKLLASMGDYAGYGADLENAKTTAADAKAKMEEAAETYKALGGQIDIDGNDRVANTVKGGLEGTLSNLLGSAGNFYEGGTRGSKAQIERDVSDMQKQADKAQQTYNETLEKYGGDVNNVNVQAAARALAEVKSNLELYQGMLENRSLENTTQAIYGASDKWGTRSAEDIAAAKEGLGKTGQFLVDTGAAGVQMLGDIALGKITGLGMMPVMGARSFGGAANEARQAGASYEQQTAYGAAAAAVEMLTEKIADGLAGVAGKGAADDVAKEVIRKWAKTDAGRTALRAIYGVTGEAAEEAISDLVNPAIRAIYDKGASAKESYGTKEGRKALLMETLHDAAVGGALGGLGSVGSVLTGQNAAELADMRRADASMGNVQSQVNNAFDVLNGRLTPEQMQAREADARARLGIEEPSAPAAVAPEAPAPAAPAAPTEQNRNMQDMLLEAAGIAPAAQTAETAPAATPVETTAPAENTPEIRQAQIQQRIDEINAELDNPNIDDARVEELFAEGDALYAEKAVVEQQIAARNTQQARIENGEVSKRFNQPENHIDNRTPRKVEHQSVKAFQYDHPELHQHFVKAAQDLMALTQSAETIDTTIRNRSTDSKYYTNKRNRYADTVRSLVELNLTKPEILKACQDIIDNNGAENYSKAKKVELVLNDMLTNGYTMTEGLVEPNADYIAAKEAINGAKTQPAADSWEAYLERNSLSLALGEVTEEQLRAEWEAQQGTAETQTEVETEPAEISEKTNGRRHIDFSDKAAHEQAFSEKVQSLIDSGKTIEITDADIQSQAEKANWSNIQAVRKYIRDSLQAIFGNDSVFFDNDGSVVEAYLTREGRKHSAPSVTNSAGAAAMLKARELVSKSEYVFSTDHDIHSKAGQNIDPDTIWDYYEAVVKYGNETIPVRFSLRNVRDDPRAQINKIAVNADGINTERVPPYNNRPPQDAARPVDNGETLSEDRVPQPAPVVNGENGNPAGPTTAESTNGMGPERERGGSANIRTNENAEADLRQSFEESPETYRQLTNAEVQAKADAILAKGHDAARSEVEQAIGRAKVGYKLAPEYLVAGFEVANELTRRGDTEAGNRLMADIFAEQTAGGQLGQLGRLLRRSSPAVKGLTVENIVNKINENLTKGQLRRNQRRGRGDAEGRISVDQTLIDNFTNAQTDADSDAALDAIKDDIARQIPATFRDKFTALRYLNMLGNLKTQGRNIVGNTAMMAATNVKYTVQAVNELVASAVSGGKYERTTSLTASRQLRQQARADFEANVDDIKGESKYSDVAKQATRDIEERRQIFDFKPLEAARKLTNWAMDAGDVIFMKTVYTRSFAGWMQAHGIEDVSNATPDQIARAREFATKEAREATFHDDNAVSNWVSSLGRGKNTPDFVKSISEGVMPFRKTPANVAVRAVEYSPVGLAETIYKGVQAAKGKGDTTTADVINSLSKNVTGSALMIAGYFLSAAGMARGSNDDDEELSAFQKMQGAMDYSVKIGDTNVSLSQFAPMAIPFFMGVKLNELMESSDEPLSLDSAKDILGIVTDPMLEMSMLSGVNDFLNDLSSMNGDTDAIPSLVTNAAINYLSQGLTNSLLGQLEQANERNRQTTYTDTKSEDATEFDKRLGSGYQRKLAQIAAKIPGIDYHQNDYIDAWGRKISTGDTAQRYFNALLNPTYTSQDNSTEVDAELERLYTENQGIEGFPDVLPKRRGRSATYDMGKVMTPEEYQRYAIDSGSMKLELVKDFIGSEQYSGLSDRERAEVISKLYSFADDRAVQRVKDSHGITTTSDWQQLLEGTDKPGTANDVPALDKKNAAEYIYFTTLYNDAKKNGDYARLDSLLTDYAGFDANTQSVITAKKPQDMKNLQAFADAGSNAETYYTLKEAVGDAQFEMDATSANGSHVRMSGLGSADIPDEEKDRLVESGAFTLSNTAKNAYEILRGYGYTPAQASAFFENADWYASGKDKEPTADGRLNAYEVATAISKIPDLSMNDRERLYQAFKSALQNPKDAYDTWKKRSYTYSLNVSTNYGRTTGKPDVVNAFWSAAGLPETQQAPPPQGYNQEQVNALLNAIGW